MFEIVTGMDLYWLESKTDLNDIKKVKTLEFDKVEVKNMKIVDEFVYQFIERPSQQEEVVVPRAATTKEQVSARNSRDERRDETIAITRLLTIVPRLVSRLSSRLVFVFAQLEQLMSTAATKQDLVTLAGVLDKVSAILSLSLLQF